MKQSNSHRSRFFASFTAHNGKTLLRWTIVGIALLAVGSAFAQVRGRRRPQAGTLTDLAINPAIMKELGIEDGSPEAAMLRSSSEAMGKEMEEMVRERAKAGRSNVDETVLELQIKLQARSDPELRKLLTPKQYTRLKQINWQMKGPRALSDPEVVAALEIDAKQREKLMLAISENARRQRELFKDGVAQGNPDEIQNEIMKINADLKKEINEVLSMDQRDKFAALKGEPFDLGRLNGAPTSRTGSSGGGSRETAPDQKSREKKKDK